MPPPPRDSFSPSAGGAGAASFSVLVGAAGRLLPPEKRGFAAGVINAGGSFGQFVFAPVLQKLITAFGWMSAMWFTAFVMIAALPLARVLRRKPEHATATQSGIVGSAVKGALADPSYLLLHAGFFTCGFHIAFLVTHLPGEITLCGLPASVASWSLAIIGLANVAGSLAAGWGVSRYLGKHILFGMYASRTVPPTATVVGKLFGQRYLSTLFGLTLLSHQIGGFLGAS